jgi:serine/threonine-protein kinase
MAKLIVQKAAAVSRDREELCSILSENIDDADTRRKFVEAFHRTASGARSAAPGASSLRSGTHAASVSAGQARPASGVTRVLDDAFIDRVTTLLAKRIGPIARVVVRKAAQQAHARGELVRLVAADLEDDARTAFLNDVGQSDR